MTAQPSLFDAPAKILTVHLPDPTQAAPGRSHALSRDTERAAALAIMPRTGILRYRVLEALADVGEEGLTDDELAIRLNVIRYTAAPRRGELLTGGWVEDSGLRRATGNGGTSIAWRLSEEGLRRWRDRT